MIHIVFLSLIALPLLWAGKHLHPVLIATMLISLPIFVILSNGSAEALGATIVFCLLISMLLVLGPLLIDATSLMLEMNWEQRTKTIVPTLKLSVIPIAVVLLAIFCGAMFQKHLINETLYKIPAFPTSKQGYGCERTYSALVCAEHDPTATAIHPMQDIDIAINRIEGVFTMRVRRTAHEAIKTEADARLAEIKFSEELWTAEKPIFPRSIKDFDENLNPGDKCGRVEFVWSLIRGKSDCVKKALVNSVEKIYKSSRAVLKNNYDKKIKLAGVKSSRGVATLETATEAFIAEDISDTFEEFRKINRKSFQAFFWINISGFIFSIFVLLKFLFLIFARFLFHAKYGGRTIRLLSNQPSPNNIKEIGIKDITVRESDSSGQRYGFTVGGLDEWNTFEWHIFHHKLIRPLNEGHYKPLFLPLQLFFARLFHQRLSVTSFNANEHQKFGASGDANSVFIAVKLLENQQLAVKLENLLAITNNIRLKSVYSLGLANLIHRRLFLRVVEGIGTKGGWLILNAQHGGLHRLLPHNISDHGDRPQSASPESLAAFDPQGTFTLDADHGAMGSYKGGYSLWPADDETTALYATTTKHYRGWVMPKSLLFVLLPIPL